MRNSCKDLSNKIISYNDAESIGKLLANEGQGSLVVFDADKVLFDLVEMRNELFGKGYIKEHLNQRVGHEKTVHLMCILLRDGKYQAVESMMKDIVKNLQSRDIKVLVLTAYLTGKFGVIESMDDFRIEQLQNLGYHFEKSWQNLEKRYLINISDSHDYTKGSHISKPLFQDGVVFADQGNKGEMLSAFLKYADFRPDKIIFIDDKMKYLKSVANMASEECIEFIGIEYTRAILDKNITPQKTMIFHKKISVLINKEIWISGEEALAMHSYDTYDM